MKFKEKVLRVVLKIPEGHYLTYKEVAKKSGFPNAQRAVGRILAKNKDFNIPCHRVIFSNGLVGGYLGKKELSFIKAGLLLKEGAIGVIPTDTLYGICTSAFKRDSVEKIYKLKKRDPKKPLIVLISSFDDLKKFEVKLSSFQKEILKKIWPGSISVILNCSSRKFFYLHRGTRTLAFRLPKENLILKILKISGPLVAPSANIENQRPAQNIKEAWNYFQNKVFYLDGGIRKGQPSTIIDLTKRKIKIIRKGASLKKLKNIKI